MTVVAFLIFPASTNSFNVDSFRAQAIVKQLRETVNDVQADMGHRLFDACLRGQVPQSSEILHHVSLNSSCDALFYFVRSFLFHVFFF